MLRDPSKAGCQITQPLTREAIDFGGGHEAVTKKMWKISSATFTEHQAAEEPQTPLILVSGKGKFDFVMSFSFAAEANASLLTRRSSTLTKRCGQ
jgi:hypothetical protein